MDDFGIPRPDPSLVMTERFEPCLPLWDWVQSTFILEDAEICNADHGHLSEAYIGFLWAGPECNKGVRKLAGTAQLGKASGTAWTAGRAEQQLTEWFHRLPDFLITLDVRFFATCSDAEACAVIEHELYHCAQAVDRDGEPRFDKATGDPVWTMRPHDIEEFYGVIERYGAEATHTTRIQRAFERKPLISSAAIRGVCGLCAQAA